MKKLSIRLVSLLLSISLLLPALTLPVLAYRGQGVGADISIDNISVNEWTAALTSPDSASGHIELICQLLGIPYSTSGAFWALVDEFVRSQFIVGEVGFDELRTMCNQLNSLFNSTWDESFFRMLELNSQALSRTLVCRLFFNLDSLDFVIEPWGTSGVYRIREKNSGRWFVNSVGQYPCASYAQGGEEVRGRHWRPASEASSHVVQKKPVNMQSNHSLASINEMIIQTGLDSQIRTIANKYNAIWYDYQYYCDANGYPFVAPIEEDQWGVNQDRVDTEVRDENGDPAVDEDGEVIEENNEGNSTNIDFSGMTITLPTGDLILADSVLYDESTKTYQIDARQYVEEGDTYIYNTYEYTYHVNYTSITYIGQTEEYSKYFEVYYELPDGRSSADLTKEELEQLNVSMDVIPYGRSADDTSLRSLYHFDGDTRDSSYWNYCTEFTWNKGASLTYMDAGVFDGALYLDENEHDFTIKLPSSIGSGDFTIQFRYYQSATAAPVVDSYVSFSSGSTVLYPVRFDGAHLLSGSQTTSVNMPVGTWNEIAIVRSGAVCRVYLNGLIFIAYSAANAMSTSAIGDTITFHFGSEQQTFKYLDELRVLHKAIVADGASYSPTSVPYDTNLSLVLPTSAVPVADEYWDIHNDSQVNLLEQYDMADWMDRTSAGSYYATISSSSTPYSDKSLSQDPHGYWQNIPHNSTYVGSKFPSWFSFKFGSTALTSFSYSPSGVSLVNNKPSSTAPTFGTWLFDGSALTNKPAYGLISRIGLYSVDGGWSTGYGLSPTKDYTFSMVCADRQSDGSVQADVGSISFRIADIDVPSSWAYSGSSSLGMLVEEVEFHNYLFQVFALHAYGNPGFTYVYLVVTPNGPAVTGDEFVYLELVEGSSTDLRAEFVSKVTAIEEDELNTPTLAVRTDVNITNHQIGGPRPSVPTKGQVWALVEDGTIRSLQVYTGTAWEAVDGRIWTGSRWVPASSYNIITLQDLYDIKDATQDYEYIYTETGFWSWWQKAWNKYVADIDKRFDELIKALGGGSEPETDCEHVYTTKVIRDPGCVEPGLQRYTCGSCGHSYTETIDATGHDWLVIDRVEPVLDEEGNVLEEGYDILECSVCGKESRDYGEGPVEEDLFDALGNFLAEGVDWLLAKLTELSDSLRSITDTFTSFAAKVGELAGGFPAFFGAFIVLIPEDLQTIMWFAVIGFVVLCVYKKWAR